MRRTNEEFKAELEKRCCAYRREQARKRKNLLTAALCVSICCVAAAVFDPFGARSEAPQAADMLAGGGLKSESAMSQQKDGTVTRFPQVTQWEYCFSEAAPVEDEAAPMAPETNMSTTGDPGAAPRAEAQETMAADVSVSTRSAVNSWPLNEADALEVLEYLQLDGWEEGSTRCLMDCKMFVNGRAYEYSARCGVLYDPEKRLSLVLDDPARQALNELLRAYIPIAEEYLVTVTCGSETVTLDAADSAVILEYLCADGWIMSAANCLCDYTLEVNGQTYRYHSDCGTVQNDDGKSLTLSEKDKAIFNDIVSRCPMRIE